MAKLRREDPMLALVRDPLLSRVDRRLAAIIGGSLLVHIGLAIVAWTTDVTEPERTPVAAIPVEFDQVDIMIPDFTPPQQVTNNAPGVAAPVAPNQTPHPIVHRSTIRPQITTGSQIDPTQLGGLFDTDDSHTRQPKLDLGGQVIAARDHDVHIGTDRNPTEDPHLANHDETPLTQDPSMTHVTPSHRDEPEGRVIPGAVKPKTTTTLTPKVVLDLIQSQYMRGLQRCYGRGLASEGSLSGSVSIEFTVDPGGDVSTHAASGVSPGVDACIDGQMGTWRFPSPHDSQGNATHATFAITLALQPS